MEDSGNIVDLTGFNESDMTSDAELAQRLQMEELETLNASDFEVARHLQEMERQSASHFLPELFMFGEPIQRSNFGHQAEPWRRRPPRPPAPMLMEFSETSNNDKPNAASGEPSTQNTGEGATSSDPHQGAASASLSHATSSRFGPTRRAQRASNRYHRDPAAFSVFSNGTATDAERSRDADDSGEPVGDAAAASNVSSFRVERLREAMSRNFLATDAEQSRGAANRNRNRNRFGRPVVFTPPHDTAGDAQDSRDALNFSHVVLMGPLAPATDADTEQPYHSVPPPLPPRRQRRQHRNRRVQMPVDMGWQFGLRPIGGFHESLRMPGWNPIRRHYEYSRMLDEDDGSGNNYDALWELSEQIGEATNKGLNLVQITRLPTMKYTAPSSDDTTSDNATSSCSSSEPMSDATLAAMETMCRVCLCSFENGEVLRALPCCHRFHVDCIDQWIKQNAICPVCRDNIKDHLRTGDQ